MKMILDFQSDEVVAVLQLVVARMRLLQEQPPSQERQEELAALYSFTVKLGPLIHAEVEQEAIQFKASMN